MRQQIFAGQYMGKFIFTRHGQTDYTEIFPDLTDAGKETIKTTAIEIAKETNGDEIMIFSSPRQRARGTAFLIRRTLRLHCKVIIEERIREAVVRDKEKGAEIYRQHVAKGQDNLSINYGRDPRYEDATIVEPRSKVKERFFQYLEYAIRVLLSRVFAEPPGCFVHVSHYEFLYHFVEDIFKLDYSRVRPLLHGELIVVSVYRTDSKDFFDLEVKFRGKTKRVLFDCKTKTISLL